MRTLYSQRPDFDQSIHSAIAVSKSDTDPILDSANFNKRVVSKFIMHTHASAVQVSWKSFDTVDGLQEVSTIGCLAPTGLSGLGFILHDAAGSVAVWFDESGTDPDPAWIAAYDRAIKVDISDVLIVTDEDVAAELADTLDADAAFSANATAEVVTVTDIAAGPREDIADAPDTDASGFDLTVTTQGGMYGFDAGFEAIDAPRIVRTAILAPGILYPIVTDQIMDTGTTPTTCVALW